MRELKEIRQNRRVQIDMVSDDGGSGWIRLSKNKSARPAVFVFSNGLGWEHVSVSFEDRTPTWDEMCMVKDTFFRDDEACVEYHPAKSEYVNMMPYCLHIWRPMDKELPTPPPFMVGIKPGQTVSELKTEIEKAYKEYENGRN